MGDKKTLPPLDFDGNNLGFEDSINALYNVIIELCEIAQYSI